MNIIYNPDFENKLNTILEYIAKDKPSATIKFALELEEQILNIPTNPLMYEKSKFFRSENIRDMVYKKYTIVYEINFTDEFIEIIEIFNRNKPVNINNC